MKHLRVPVLAIVFASLLGGCLVRRRPVYYQYRRPVYVAPRRVYVAPRPVVVRPAVGVYAAPPPVVQGTVIVR